jgi:hypothetical protein
LCFAALDDKLMQTAATPNETLFRIFAALIAGAAVYHVVGLFVPALSPQTPAWRHGLFVAINAVAAWLMLRRPPWFWVLFGLLTLQQLYGHGSKIMSVWRDEGQIEWISLATVIAMPVMTYLLYRDWRVSREADHLP